jgi:type IV pilus assembly protein PilW
MSPGVKVMKPTNQPLHSYQTGFSLVEIMVGLVIGLLASLVVLQVFSVFEGQKRTTTGVADAQTNGNVALYGIKRDLGMAGYGLLPIINTPLDCGVTGIANFNIDSATGITATSQFSPVTITDGGTGAGASDIIKIHYSTANTGGATSQISVVGNPITVIDNLGCNQGDLAMVIHSSKGSCGLTTVTGVDNPTPHKNITLNNPQNAALGENLACLGKWTEIEYRINQTYDPTSSTASKSQAYLQRKATLFPDPNNKNPTQGDPSVTDIVNIQAQYGISATADTNKIVQWVNAKDISGTNPWNTAVDGPVVIDPATGAGTNFGPSLTIANRNLIKAIRIAVVARNGLLEKTYVTDSCSSLTANAPSGLCAWAGSSAGTAATGYAPAIDLSNDTDATDPTLPARWRRYRYRVFETVIPMRNVIWSWDSLP